MTRIAGPVFLVLMFGVACGGTDAAATDTTTPDDVLVEETQGQETAGTETLVEETSVPETTEETAATDTAPADTATTDTAPTDTAATDTAPTDTAPTDTAPTDTAPTDTAPTDVAVATFTCPGGVCSPSGQGETMKPGQNCNSCHSWQAAGTVYGVDGKTCGSSKQGVPGVNVYAVPAGGGNGVLIGQTNCVGTFIGDFSGISDGKYNFKVEYTDGTNTWTKTMGTTQNLSQNSSIGCASCHTSSGAAGAPIHL